MSTHNHTHYHYHQGSEILERLEKKIDEILKIVNINTNNQKTIIMDLDQLTADVTNNTTVEQSAITLLNGLSQQLKDAGTDPAKLAALQTSLETSTAALAAAITANTPAAAPAGDGGTADGGAAATT